MTSTSLALYDEGGVIPIAMSMNFSADDFKEKIARGFSAMAEKDGPYLIHCTEGKDRTGFMCMLIEALAGATYQEIVDDYMITYDNYYEISEVKDKVKYDLILEKNLIPMMYTVVGDSSLDLKTIDLSSYARAFLIDVSMTEAQVDALLARITE